MVRVNCQNGDGGGSWVGDFLGRTFPKGSATQSGPSPKKVGNPPVWKPPGLASLKKRDIPGFTLRALPVNFRSSCGMSSSWEFWCIPKFGAKNESALLQDVLLISAVLRAQRRSQNLCQTPVRTKLRLKRFPNLLAMICS